MTKARSAGLTCVYVAYKLIIEYEGNQHRTDRNQWNPRHRPPCKTSPEITGH